MSTKKLTNLAITFELEGEITTVTFEEEVWKKEWIEDKIRQILDLFRSELHSDFTDDMSGKESV